MDAREVADRLEIEQVVTRYANALDRRDWDALRSLFTDDAVVDYSSFDGPRGTPDEAVAWIEPALAGFEVVRHQISNLEVDIDGDEATASCYLFNPMGRRQGDALTFFYVGGSYHDRLRRTPDGWRIAERRAHAEFYDLA